MADKYEVLAERGSLELRHYEGDDMEPETFLVVLRENPRICGSLQAAADWFELSCGDYKLNGSQAQTVDKWLREYL